MDGILWTAVGTVVAALSGAVGVLYRQLTKTQADFLRAIREIDERHRTDLVDLTERYHQDAADQGERERHIIRLFEELMRELDRR